MNIQDHVQLVAEQIIPDNFGDVYKLIIDEVNIGTIKAALTHTNGNQSKAAKLLGVNRGTLRKRIEAYELKLRAEG